MIETTDVHRFKQGLYQALTPDAVPGYLRTRKGLDGGLSARLAATLGNPSQWQAREMGDGNLNLVFIVSGPAGSVVVKQALPYVRMVGESWPLALSRSHYESAALLEQARWARRYVPAVYDIDAPMASIVMEHLSPHVVLRKGLTRGIAYPLVGEHLGRYLADTLFHTSDLHLPADEKKRLMARFLGNTAMCKITEDLIFDEPYYDAPMNRHTPGFLDGPARRIRGDVELKLAVQDMKWRFLNHPECLVHGDLHTGSVMVTAEDTRVIDPEFAFYGPMGFDIGVLLANLLMAFFSQPGHEIIPGERADHAAYLLEQAITVWSVFSAGFAAHGRARSIAAPGGDLLHPRLSQDAPQLQDRALERRSSMIWDQALGFAGCEMIRRILGLSHVEDFDSIAQPDRRAACELRALALARSLLIERAAYRRIEDVTAAASATAADIFRVDRGYTGFGSI
jgi:5-methylthioribose kinase